LELCHQTAPAETVESGQLFIYASIVLLSVFLHHPQLVLSRDQLLDLTCGRDADVFDRSIDNRISRLRKKIEADPKQPKLIKTHWGGGYSFTAEVLR
jgi:two-component system OmpR family response regulator